MKGLLIAAGVIALMALGFIFLKLPPPVIIVAPETVFHAPGLDITNTMFTSWIVVTILVVTAILVGPKASVVPSGFYGYIEAAVMALYNIVEQVAGPENGRRFFPLVGTIFFYILVSNYFGLLPMNAVIGVPEPNHGDTQAVFSQTTVAGIDLAYLPLQVDTVDIAAGEHPLLPEGVELSHGDESHAEEGEHSEGAEGEATGTSESHGAVIGATSASLVSAVPGGVDGSLAVSAEAEEFERTTDGRFSGILAPYFRSVMTDITAPLAIAIFSFIFVEFWGLQTLGLGYLGKFFAFGAIKKGPLGIIDIFVGILELVSEFSRIVSFTFRLFGNIFAGEVLLLMMTFLVPFLLVDVFYGLELFVGLIQAFVFAMLTTVFAVTAVSHHGGEHDEHGEHGGDPSHAGHAPAH
ncbi:MAG: F0F1 ATP synthase subunit A [Dehalococcoidia bacterium]